MLTLRDAGYEGLVTIISRRGFLPQSHTRRSAEPVFPTEPLPERLSAILRFVRKACREAEATGQSWQAVMNGFRKHARPLWRALPEDEKRRFNRHLRALYDSHRNRLPEALHLRLERELTGGNTVLRRGRFLRHIGGTGVVIRPQGQAVDEEIAAESLIDCRCRTADLSGPLMQSLFEQGLAQSDGLGLGIAVSALGEAIVDGRITEGLFAMGPLGLGSLPDIDLVPEIASQAYAAADHMASQLSPTCVAV